MRIAMIMTLAVNVPLNLNTTKQPTNQWSMTEIAKTVIEIFILVG